MTLPQLIEASVYVLIVDTLGAKLDDIARRYANDVLDEDNHVRVGAIKCLTSELSI
jgi:hypothetical protein